MHFRNGLGMELPFGNAHYLSVALAAGVGRDGRGSATCGRSIRRATTCDCRSSLCAWIQPSGCAVFCASGDEAGRPPRSRAAIRVDLGRVQAGRSSRYSQFRSHGNGLAQSDASRKAVTLSFPAAGSNSPSRSRASDYPLCLPHGAGGASFTKGLI